MKIMTDRAQICAVAIDFMARVRQIGAAPAVQINTQQPAQLQRPVRSLERPVLLPGHSQGQERLAAEFLKNTPEKNNADPRLAPAQAIVEAAPEDRTRLGGARAWSGRSESRRASSSPGASRRAALSMPRSARHLIAPGPLCLPTRIGAASRARDRLPLVAAVAYASRSV